jgi:hypothetical protein
MVCPETQEEFVSQFELCYDIHTTFRKHKCLSFCNMCTKQIRISRRCMNGHDYHPSCIKNIV